MTKSRWASIIAVLGAVSAVALTLAQQIPGEYGVVLAGIGAAVAAFNERIQGRPDRFQ